jgi:sirohydrochlorin cobaltochelatase
VRIAIVLAMHGTPPSDFPRQEMAELFDLRARLKHAAGPLDLSAEHRHAELDAKMRAWPRTAQNDPFYAGSEEMAKHLRRETGWDVIVGFNEFCGPSLDEALEKATTLPVEKVIVITPMMTQGGEHSKTDIPAAIHRAQGRHPDVPILYAWPFEVSDVAQFLAKQIGRFI